MRGGLLVVARKENSNININSLQLLVNKVVSSDPIPCDTAYLDTMKELRKSNLLLKEDMTNHRLLINSCHPQVKMRFEYLAEWDLDCLMTGTCRDRPLIHEIIKRNSKDLSRFTLYFEAALTHHPQHLGLLFQKDKSGQTACAKAIDEYGKDEAFNVITQCIPTDTKLPINS
jgi:hypothetical protein